MSWLSGIDLLKAIETNADEATRQAFYGIYSIDVLPTFVPHYPLLLIVNTDTRNLPGTHWKVIFIDKDRRGEIFDSLAYTVNPMMYRWMNRFTRSWIRSEKIFQLPLAATCGAYTLYFVLNRLSHKSMSDTMRHFNTSFFDNEEKVLTFYAKLL